ncbi:Regulator of protease activity HflC, stomatin/prohibitin superfamily [Actinacidiphila alni]|uniref:Regulator of protease activity HflC, stomatin/prohibitin superfamily n=1 Tax=Actinacidiphila alni TaxID=380248 RepID=A0A1I2E8E2_9ACTN|nr:SPFH domain-containing protein [Actinacidiphila alni]SFE88530.1 Regulator of protease activity HflC, stomatin/prohibitin superfamily [Actinacidiphila alni]
MTTPSTAAGTGLPEQTRPGAHSTDGSALPAAPAELVERPGPCLPGWTAGLTLTAATGGIVWLLWRAGVLPAEIDGRTLLPPPPGGGSASGLWSGILLLAAVAAFAAGGLTRGRNGSVWVLTRHGAYQGTVRRTGLIWISPLLTRRRLDVALRHWRSRPIDAVDANGTPLQISVLLVWRVRDTAKAAFAVDDYDRFLREQVEAAVALAVSRHPADDFRGAAPTLRDSERLGDHLTRLIAADQRPVGIEVFSATPVRLDYAPEVAAAMRRAQIAALDAKHRRAVLDDVLATVAETVRGITERGLVQLDDYERKALVRDLTVALSTTTLPKK